MPITFTADAAARRILAVAVGPISLADYRAHLEARRQAGLLAYDHILDLRRGTIDFDLGGIPSLVRSKPNASDGESHGNNAVVAIDDVTYELARQLLFHASAQDAKAEVFRSMEAAEAWLAFRAALTEK